MKCQVATTAFTSVAGQEERSLSPNELSAMEDAQIARAFAEKRKLKAR